MTATHSTGLTSNLTHPKVQVNVTVSGPNGERIHCYRGGRGYPRLRPFARSQYGQPTVSLYRVLLHIAWGAPTIERNTACHCACDIHVCCNIFHGRWGTRADNDTEAGVLEAWRAAYLPLTENEKGQVAPDHPALAMMMHQGAVPKRLQ